MPSPVLSLVVCVLNEEDNIPPVCQEIARVLPQLPETEIIFLDDGSHDGTVCQLLKAREFLPGLRVLSHDRRLGKSAALRSAIKAARGRWIATMDGDGQDDPAEIPALFNMAQEAQGRAPLVVGLRLERHDNFSRRFATRFANGLRRRLLKDGCPDTGAPMKLFLREDFLQIPQFEGVHRFLPALFHAYGIPVTGRPIKHRARLHGRSKYTNLNRAIVGVRDTLGVMWLRSRTHIPSKLTEH